MADSIKTLAQLKKADKLVKLVQREKGPRSFRRGIGALLRVVAENDGATQRELVELTDWSRHNLKNIVKKAEKAGFVTIEEDGTPRTYRVSLTEAGKEVAAKRNNLYKQVSDEICGVLTEEEQVQLDALTDKLIAGIKKNSDVCARKKGYKIHKGHRGHRPHCAKKHTHCAKH